MPKGMPVAVRVAVFGRLESGRSEIQGSVISRAETGYSRLEESLGGSICQQPLSPQTSSVSSLHSEQTFNQGFSFLSPSPLLHLQESFSCSKFQTVTPLDLSDRARDT